MLADLEALVRLESPTQDLEACKNVVRLASDIASRVLDSPAEIRDVNGRPVFWWGSPNPEVIVLAHLDTVWPKGSFEPLWQIEGTTATGPGVFDMKAGFIQALYAMKSIKGPVALVATTDEETGSLTSKEFIKEISAKAKSVHAGLEPEKGINATVEVAHVVIAVSNLANVEFGTTVVPTTLAAGNSTNTVPDLAVLDIDIRSFSMAELNRVDAAIKAIIPVNPETRYEVSGGFNRPPLESSSTMALYERAEKVAKEIGMPALGHASVGGASDGNFAAAAGAQVLDGLGAVGSGAHAKHEWVDISTLEDRSKLLNALIKDLLNE